MKQSIDPLIERVRSIAIYVRDDHPRLIFRLEAAEKIDPSGPGYRVLCQRIRQALDLNRLQESQIVDLWPLDLWEYDRTEYEYFNDHPEAFTGFSECGVARILSHVAVTLDLGGPAYLFVMYNVAEQTVDLRGEINRNHYDIFLENIPF
jgi:hypothetical protein